MILARRTCFWNVGRHVCACLRRLVTTPTSTPVSSMRTIAAFSFEVKPTPCNPIGATCPSHITVELRRFSLAFLQCCCRVLTPLNVVWPNSSIVVSGTPIHRPVGQILPEPRAQQPILSASRKLDYELEVGFVSAASLRNAHGWLRSMLILLVCQFYGGSATRLGERLSPAQAADHVFGAVILCDWSARDIQTWEYVPLGT